MPKVPNKSPSRPKRFFRLRLFSPLGHYPASSVEHQNASLIVSNEIVFSVVRVLDQARHGITTHHYTEFDFLSLEEIRFLAAISLSLRPDEGAFYTYPLPLYKDIPARPTLDREELHRSALEFARTLDANRYQDPTRYRAAVLPPLLGGPQYPMHTRSVDAPVFRAVMQKAKLVDHLQIRGLGALISSGMLSQRYELGDAAAMMLHVALEVSFQLVLRLLTSKGVRNPSALDAGALIDQVFGNELRGFKYFEEYYEDRIKTIHPSSRFGIFPYSPIGWDDIYILRKDLIEVYVWLITGYIWDRLDPMDFDAVKLKKRRISFDGFLSDTSK